MKTDMPNFSEYSLKELLEVYQDLDKDAYPDRFEILSSEIQKRKKSIALQKAVPAGKKSKIFRKGLSILISIYILWTTIEVIKTTVKGTFHDLFYSEFHYNLHLITNTFTIIIGILTFTHLFINLRRAGYFQSLWFLPQLLIILKNANLNSANFESVTLRSFDAMVGFQFSLGFGLTMTPPGEIFLNINLFALLGIALSLYASQELSEPGVGEK